jgi:hypothetical protein
VLPQADIHEAILATINSDDFKDRDTYVGASEVGDCQRLVTFRKLHPDNAKIVDPHGAGRMLAGRIIENAIVQLVRNSMKGIVRETGHKQVELVDPTVPLRTHPDGRLSWSVVLQPGQSIAYLDHEGKARERTEPLEGMGGLEIKTAGMGVYRKYVKGGLPIRYVDQANTEMGLGGTKWLLLVLVSRDNIADFVSFLLFFDEARFQESRARAAAVMTAKQAIKDAQAVEGADATIAEFDNLPMGEIERGYCAYCPLNESCPQFNTSGKDLSADAVFPEDVAPTVEVLSEEYREIKPIADRAEIVKDALKEHFFEHGVKAQFGLFIQTSKGRKSFDSDGMKAADPKAFEVYEKFSKAKQGDDTYALKIARVTGTTADKAKKEKS